ncbi:DNA mismatch repair protein Mlh1-like [Styela clava]
MSSSERQPVIRKLDEDVVNRIAAGEVIQRPANALKEMLENSLDAGSTSITVTIKVGGLKMLQISDNGHGIRKEDMGIVCERFTTSKLKEFSDLRSIATFGFRGEALASISHVSHLTICTRTKESKCAYKASYIDGKVKDPPRPTAGNVGTQITVEDLFYNVPIRRKALNNASEEHQRIADVISKYAIHNSGIGFTLRKITEGNNAGNDVSVRTQSGSSIADNIGLIYGSYIAKELLHVNHTDESLKYKMSGWLTNANCSMKKFNFLLFINQRLVDCTSLKRALDSVYQTFLPKGSHPFVYMSLEISPANIDVNVHPTKHEVHFLHEEEIIESVQKAVEMRLRDCNHSRSFYTQTLLPTSSNISTQEIVKQKATTELPHSSKVYDHQMVRTDSKLQKLDAFLNVFSSETQENKDPSKVSTSNVTTMKKTSENINSGAKVLKMSVPKQEKSDNATKDNLTSTSFPKRRQIKLTSVLTLQEEIRQNAHSDLVKIMSDHTWVGCIDPELALIQHGTKLYLTNTTRLSEELFYQIMIYDFGNFGIFRLSEPAPTIELVKLALDDEESGWKPADGNKSDLANHIVEFLKDKADMLSDYFSFEVDGNGNITGIPMLLKDYIPSMEGLPMFVLRLTTEVDWETEIDCFKTFCRECARFYSVRKGFIDLLEIIKDAKLDDECEMLDSSFSATDSTSNPPAGTNSSNKSGSWKWTIEHIVYRAFQKILLPDKSMLEDGTFLQLANLPDLYKVFERC